MIPLSKNVSYAVRKMYSLINSLCNGSKIIHINILFNPVVNFGNRNISLVLYNTSHVDSAGQYDPGLPEWPKN